MNLKAVESPMCGANRPDSPMEEVLKYLFDQVDRFDSHLGKLIDTVQQPQPCGTTCEGNIPPPYLNLREQIFKAASRLEGQNAIFASTIDSLIDELGNEKILK